MFWLQKDGIQKQLIIRNNKFQWFTWLYSDILSLRIWNWEGMTFTGVEIKHKLTFDDLQYITYTCL